MRRLLVEGSRHIVTCAVLADGETSPASEMLDRLKEGMQLDDPDHQDGEPWPDEQQPDDYIKFMAMVKHFANHGEPIYRTAINNLQHGIWEFKVSTKRFTFFDTYGGGDYNPKLRYRTTEEAPPELADLEYWWVPDFDDDVRVGHSFLKRSQATTDDDLQMSQQVREEDLTHDRP